MQQGSEQQRTITLIRESLAGPCTIELLESYGCELSKIGSEVAAELETAFAEALERQDRSAA